ncbi:MAG: hypothetical protein ACE5EC_10700 [Phycisphaerae bacterium]
MILHGVAGRCRLCQTPWPVGGKGPPVLSIAVTNAIPKTPPVPDSPGGAPFRQPLNAADRLMLVAHDGMRRIGHGGFLCQTHVWMKGRLDTEALRRGLDRLRVEHPVIAARLDTRAEAHGPCWRAEPDTVIELNEVSLDTADTASVWGYAECLYAEPLDLHCRSPVAFHLLHLPLFYNIFNTSFF